MSLSPHVQCSEQDGIAVVAPVGEFDISTVEMLRSVLIEVVNGGASKMVLDLAGTSFVDSMALGVMLGAGRRANEQGGWVRLVAPTPSVRKVLAITGLDKVFGLYDTIDQAVRHELSGPSLAGAPEAV